MLFSFNLLPLQTEMKSKFLNILVVVVCITACGNSRQQQIDELRQQTRTQFFDQKLREAQTELARTDSLLQRAEAECDSTDVTQRIRIDSLKTEADVQGAKIRYIHRKQKEMQ